MYFWLNYCDENHIERIPIAVKNINHLFHLASETILRLTKTYLKVMVKINSKSNQRTKELAEKAPLNQKLTYFKA